MRWLSPVLVVLFAGTLAYAEREPRGTDRLAEDAMVDLGFFEESGIDGAEAHDTPLLIAKKKHNKNRRRPPTSKKTTASVGKRRHMDVESAERMDMLGESNDLDPAIVSQRSKLQLDRFVAAHTKQKQFVDAVKTRVFKGGNINQKNASGQTYLHMAVLQGYDEAVDFLLKQGADKTIKDASEDASLAESVKQYKIAAKFLR